MMKSLSLRMKLIGIFIFVAIPPLLTAILVSSSKSDHEILSQATERVTMVGRHKTSQIDAYFDDELDSLRDLAMSSLIATALKDFTASFETYQANKLTAAQLAKLEEFYGRTFADKYKQVNNETLNAKEWLNNLDDSAKSAQFDFLANNDNPLGEKNNLLKASRDVPYNTVHLKYHEELGGYVKRHGLYDIFLVSPQGRVVYTFYKEADFSANISKGFLANSGLGQAFAKSTTLQVGSIHFEDFASYAPSYEAPAGFAAAPVFEDGVFLGSILIQLPLDKITQVASDRHGLGEKGQVLLLGSDGLLRADAFRQKDKYNVAASFKKGSNLKIDSEAIELAKDGKTGIVETTSYDGEPVLSFYEPLKIENETWLVICELSQNEIYAGVKQLHFLQWVILGLAIAVILAAAWLVSWDIGRKLGAIIGDLDASTSRVSEASSETESSAGQLSSSVTEQAASVQETMASAEQISAMISQNAESANKAKNTVEANDQATRDGSKAVDEMVSAIGDISDTNEKILQQMEASNKEFAEIVRIISEIGDKTKVINDIVFQTKLLSFNASVEAARAGEHGKGFAVVAEEVGNLAQMSGNAAKEITDMLTASIKRVNGIVEETKVKVEELIEIGRDKVSTGQSTANRCKTALEVLAKNASILTSMVSEIAHASKEQAQGVKEINTAISQLDQVTQQNAAVAQKSSNQAEALLSETQLLQSSVQELAIFVRGASAQLKGVNAQAATPKPDKKEPKNSGDKNGKSASVVPLRQVNKKVSPKKPQTLDDVHGEVAAVNRLAAGADIVPSSNNPKFEDF